MTLNEINKVINPNTDIEINVIGSTLSFRGSWHHAKDKIDRGLYCEIDGEKVEFRDMTIDEICPGQDECILQIWMKR